MRLDKLIADRYGLSRRIAQEAIRKGQVDLDGRECVDPGVEVETIAAVRYDPNRPRIEKRQQRLNVLYEDAQVLIIDKPANLLTQPTQDRERDTLLERVSRYLVRKHGQTKPYVGIVHRLDRDTTGAILVVTSAKALRPFQALFRAHAVDRNYLAVVEGVFLTPSGTIEMPLTADRGDGRRGVSRDPSQGVPAVTHYEVIESFGRNASLVRCRLETGRTHQIRIHLAEIGHPVIGETVYRDRKLPPFSVRFRRQALHAQVLGLEHPLTGKSIRVEAPLAADLEELLAELRQRFGSSNP